LNPSTFPWLHPAPVVSLISRSKRGDHAIGVGWLCLGSGERKAGRLLTAMLKPIPIYVAESRAYCLLHRQESLSWHPAAGAVSMR
jgi:hypothetical protein